MKYEDNQFYHVYNRGAHKESIFSERENYIYCLELMDRFHRGYGIDVFAYCLLPNHFHWALRQREGGSISKFVQNTLNAYAQAFNARYGHVGTLFEGGTKAKLVDDESYVLQLVRYVHRNPVEACLVKTPDSWDFSDYRVWCGDLPTRFTDLSLRDSQFGSGKEYARFVQSYDLEKDGPVLSRFLIGGAE
jgi:REP element-mobilizing transposase RayT